MMLKLLSILVLTSLVLAAEDRPLYTEDIKVFQQDKHKQRLEMLVGCWLMARQHSSGQDQGMQVAMVKACLKHITRKDSVVKITSLIGKNMTTTKTYAEIVPQNQIPNPNMAYSVQDQFSAYLLKMIKNYEKDLAAVNDGQGEKIKKRVDEQIQKRQKYYLGFIPANQFTQMALLIGVSIVMITLCTCWKYFNMRKEQTNAKLKQKKEYFQTTTRFTKGKQPQKRD